MGRKIHFTSLGCARNLVDTEVMLGIVLQAGFTPTEDSKKADYLVINTCGFLESARNEAFDSLKRLFAEKKENAKIIVAGCMVRLHQGELQKAFPEIHYFLSAGDVDKIFQAIESKEKGEAVGTAKSYLQMGEVPRTVSTPRQYAYLKIAEGCKKRCAFCMIPSIKGPLQSKEVFQVIREFRALLAGGAKEIILIAQDLGDFGKDRGEKGALAALLREMVKVEGDYRIRLLYLYPDEIDDEMIALLKQEKKILPYLDMPIQHIDDEVLKRMHRKTDEKQIREIIQKLREHLPDIVIRTSLMVGFPGETKEQFEKLVHFVQDAKLDNVGIFKYSKEEGTYSAKLDGHLSEEIKEEREKELALIQAEVVKKNNRKYIGKTLSVLVEKYHPESEALLTGRFFGQCPEIDGEVILNDWRKVEKLGEYYDVQITDVAGYDLIGRVIAGLPKKGKTTLNVL